MSRIASSVIDDVKQLNILDIISPYVPLVKAGRSYKGICPFHSEKTPSFIVHEDKGFFHCFGCHEAGDSITFIMKFKNLDYVDAVIYLCENFGIELKYDDTGYSGGSGSELKKLHEAFSEYAQKELFGQRGKKALDYLYSRDFDEAVLRKFSLGYVPVNMDTERFEKNFPANILTESGIFFQTRYGFKCFFSERVLFPIKSATGATIAFSGRTMDPAEKAKYKNSPETPIFSKRKELYNLHSAKDHMRDNKSCCIVEGYFDAIRMVQAGHGETVAIMGTAFTREQVAQLKRYAEEYILILDGDDAGQKAMRDSLSIALDTNIYPHVVFLPEKEDPDSFIRRNGAQAFDNLLAGKDDLILYSIKKEREQAKDDNRRFNRLERVKNMLEQIKNPHRREFYIENAAEIFEVNADTLMRNLNPAQSKKTVVKKTIRPVNVYAIHEKHLMAYLMRLDREISESIMEGLLPEHFKDENMRLIFNKMVELYEKGANINFLTNDKDLGSLVAELAVLAPDSEDIYAAAINNKNKVLLNYYDNLRFTCLQQMAEAKDEEEKERIQCKNLELMGTVMKLQSMITNS